MTNDSDYKSTLNLPQTDFPMKANLSVREIEILKNWQDHKIYKTLREAKKGKPQFILHDGPIYANGSIHIGHAVNRILKDIVTKSKSLEGFDAPFIPGWDCHGLPIELNIEKKYGKAGEKLNPKEFREKCREYAAEQINVQRESFKRLGVFGDWESPYLTMAPKFEADIIRALSQINQNGHLQQGFKPVHWCTECRSALAEAEVEYQNKISPAIDVKFRVVNSTDVNRFPGVGELSLPIWTTTPWTLPANEAVALNPLHDYVLIQAKIHHENLRLIIVRELAEVVCQRYGILPEQYQIIKTLSADELADLKLQHPIDENKIVPVVYGDHVTLETGTGAVHTAPSHGMEDYLVGQKYRLPINNPVDEKGCFKTDTLYFAGEFVFKANAHVIEKLKEKKSLLAEEKLDHSYPHCWRHKTPLIFRATLQWFISMDNHHLRENALKEIAKTQWIPDWGQSRIDGMIRNRPDWCISRQRQWCTPMALVCHKEKKTCHPDMAVISEKIAKKIEQGSIEAWYDADLKDLLSDTCDPDSEKYEKVSDTLDVWFDSGVTHFAVLQSQMADLYLEGTDQHRGWFHSSLLTAVAMEGHAPYKTVLTHGFTVDDKNRKMSKSLGNVVPPEKIIKSLGADVLRLWVAGTDYRAEMVVSDEIFARTSESYRRIRNTARFLLANLHDFDPQKDLLEFSSLLSLDQWLIQKTAALQTVIQSAYQGYDFHWVCQKIQHFCIVELGGFYLDIIKDRQYTMQKNSHGRRSAQTVIYHVLHALVRWIAPILSFTAEEIWSYMPGSSKDKTASIFLNEFYKFPDGVDTHTSVIDWEKILLLREEVNKAIEAKRNAGEIGSALECLVRIQAPEELYAMLETVAKCDELKFVWITSGAVLEKSTDNNLTIHIEPLHHEKCARCWHRRQDVGKNPTHPLLCSRCVDNLPGGMGEKREYA